MIYLLLGIALWIIILAIVLENAPEDPYEKAEYEEYLKNKKYQE